MVSEIDIYRSAKLLIDQHGEDAGLEAAMQADAMLEKGDVEGAATWRRIVKAVEELQRQEPGPMTIASVDTPRIGLFCISCLRFRCDHTTFRVAPRPNRTRPGSVRCNSSMAAMILSHTRLPSRSPAANILSARMAASVAASSPCWSTRSFAER